MICKKSNRRILQGSEDFGSVKRFQYLLEGQKSSSDMVAPESKTPVCTDFCRFELFCKSFLKKALLFSVPQVFFISQYDVLLCLIRKTSFYQVYAISSLIQQWISHNRISCGISKCPHQNFFGRGHKSCIELLDFQTFAQKS